MTRRVFLDMDGVVVDFDGGLRSYNGQRARDGLPAWTGDDLKCMPQAYLDMEPIDGAIDGVRSLIGMGFDVWLATKPPTGIAHAYGDKAAWVFKHLPELKRKLIITHDKGMLGCAGDVLVDDRPWRANCRHFNGELVWFGEAENKEMERILFDRDEEGLSTRKVPEWQGLLDLLRLGGTPGMQVQGSSLKPTDTAQWEDHSADF